MEKRNTQLYNGILLNLLSSYSETQIRIFLATINKVVTKHYKITNEENREDIYSYDSLTVEIPLEFYKENIKSKYGEVAYKEIIKGINIPIKITDGNITRNINIIDEIIYDESTRNITVIFDEKYFEYVILLSNSNYTVIDLEEIKKLSGKYEIGIYLCYWQFVTKGIRKFNIESVRNFFDYNAKSDAELVRKIKIATDKVNNKFGYNIIIDTDTYRRKLSNVALVFPKGKRKVLKNYLY
ncbi:RepB family plasmid replication initiator protein [Clostridium senegalense]